MKLWVSVVSYTFNLLIDQQSFYKKETKKEFQNWNKKKNKHKGGKIKNKMHQDCLSIQLTV